MSNTDNLRPVFRYSRLFRPATAEPPRTEAIEELSKRMRDTGEKPRVQQTPVSGYVYFGQFIDHDLTRDETTLEEIESGKVDPQSAFNHRTPQLDLDSLYGDGPTGRDQALYDLERYTAKNARFRIGLTDPRGTSLPSTRDDLPRRGDQTAVIVDDRNDENPILSQLHVLFLKFHNRICDLLEANPPLIDSPGGTTIFDQARRLVTWHYQWFVRNDFLPEIVMDSTLADIHNHGRRLFLVKNGDTIDLPIEFTMAAFRFGHSMVQTNYTLNNDGQPINLADLLRLTRENDGTRKALPANAVIDWGRFLGVYAPGMTEFSEAIDTRIAADLFNLPPDLVSLFTGRRPVKILSLPLRTLRRGVAAHLPSGQDACGAAEIDFVPFEGDEAKFLSDHDLLEQTPLWYYLLHEAELKGSDEPSDPTAEAGKRLGPLGSRIVAEVLLGVLDADPDSFLAHSWKPPIPRSPYGPSSELSPIDSLRQLFFFADEKATHLDPGLLRKSLRKKIWGEKARQTDFVVQ